MRVHAYILTYRITLGDWGVLYERGEAVLCWQGNVGSTRWWRVSCSRRRCCRTGSKTFNYWCDVIWDWDWDCLGVAWCITTRWFVSDWNSFISFIWEIITFCDFLIIDAKASSLVRCLLELNGMALNTLRAVR